MIELVAAIALYMAMPAPQQADAPATRVERQCTRERGGGASRTSTTLVCRDVVVPIEPAPEQPAPASGPAAQPSPETEVQSAVTANVEAFNRGDVEALVSSFDANAEIYTSTGWARGADAIRARLQQSLAATPNAQIAISDFRVRRVDNNVMLADYAWTRSGVQPARGVMSEVYVRTAQGWRKVLAHGTVLAAS